MDFVADHGIESASFPGALPHPPERGRLQLPMESGSPIETIRWHCRYSGCRDASSVEADSSVLEREDALRCGHPAAASGTSSLHPTEGGPFSG